MKIIIKKCLFVIISLSLLFQSIYPPVALAQLDTPESDIAITPTPTPEPTDALLPPETPIPDPTPELNTSIPVDQPPLLQESTPVSTSEASIASPWTFTNLTLNTVYTAPQNDQVKITFTKLPETSGNLLIKEVKLTPEQVISLGAASDTAYDITSDMENGSFAYDLNLPILKSEDSLDVEYAQSVETLEKTTQVTQEKEIKEDSITIKGLDHFTIFVVTISTTPEQCEIALTGSIPGTTCFDSIQSAINAANDSDEINIKNGTYVLPSTLQINKQVSIIGESEAGTIIDATGVGAGYGLGVTASNVTLKNLTIIPNGATGGGYPIHVSDTPGLVSNLTIENLTIDGSYRTAFDIHGVTTGVIKNITAKNSAHGNGLSLSGCDNITIEGFTSSGNTWGGIALYNSKYVDPYSITHNIILKGEGFSIGESNEIYVENNTDLTDKIHDIDVQGYDFKITNNEFRGVESSNFIFYQKDLAAASSFALELQSTTNTSSVIQQISTGEYFVIPGLEIQNAINSVDLSGGIVNITSGNYIENISLPEGISGLTLKGNPGSILSGTISNASNETLNSNITISGLEIKDGSDGVNLANLQESEISDNIFTEQSSSILNLSGDFSNTVIKYNDFYLSGEVSHLYNDLSISPLFSFNYWGTGISPSPIIENAPDSVTVNTNPWLVAPKDTGKTSGGEYQYFSDDEKVSITGNGTATLYVGQYPDSPPNGGLDFGLSAIGSYYDVVAENGDVTWPLHIEIKYDPSSLPTGTIETELKGIYYQNETGWHLYSDDEKSSTGVNTAGNFVWADVYHLTPMVIAAKQDTTPPQISELKYFKEGIQIETPPTTPVVVGSIDDLTYNATFTDTDSGLNRTAFVIWDATDSWSVVGGSHKCNWNGSPSTTVLDGSESQTLLDIPLKKCSPTYTWPSGKYLITHIVYDNAGNSTYSSGGSQRFIIDSDAPNTPIHLSPVNNIYRQTSDSNFTDWSDVDDPNGVVYFYQSSRNSAFSSLLYDSAPLSISEINNPGEPSGLYYWRVKACDGLGNCSAWSTPWSINIDNSGPTVPSITFPSAETYHKISLILNQWSAASDPSGIDHYRIEYIYDDGHTFFGAPYRTTTATSRNHSPLINEQGGVRIRVQAFDKAGNEGAWSDWRHYFYDATPPSTPSSIGFSNPNLACGSFTNQRMITIDWADSSDNVALSGYDYSINYPLSSGIGRGNWSKFFTSSQYRGSLNEGRHDIQVRAKDKAGNVSGWTSLCSITYDSIAPTSTITSPSNEGPDSVIYSNNWNGNIAGTASDLNGISRVDLSIKRIDNQYWDGSNWVDFDGEGTEPRVTAEGTTSWTYTFPDPGEDSYQIVSHAIDLAGNIENSYKLTLVYDKTIPELTISVNPVEPDSGNGWYKTQPEVTLIGSDTNIKNIEFQWDGTVNGKWTEYTTPFKPGTEGSRVLYYRALDKASNYSDTGIKNIRWDQTDVSKGPQNLSVSPNPTSGSEVKVKWDAGEDAVGLDRYEIRWSLIGGSTSYSAGVSINTFTYTLDRLTEGSWDVVVEAVDGAGNRKNASQTLIVDRTPPTAPILVLSGTNTGTTSLSWNKIEDAVDYIIWYGTVPGERLFGARTGDTTSFTVKGLGSGTYYFIIKSIDAAQNQSSESNEINTGSITGAPGVEPGQPAVGFTPDVQGVNTDEIPSPTQTQEITPSVLGKYTTNNRYRWHWLLLFIPLPFIFYFSGKRKRS